MIKKSKTELIDISLIDENNKNEEIFNMEDIEYLSNHIKQEGFHGFIEVFKKDDRYEIISGHRRFRALKLLKETKIPAIVINTKNDFDIGIKLLSSNLHNRRLTPLDMARAIQYYKELLISSNQKQNFKKQATEFFNISPAQLYRYQCLLKLIPELQELANSPEFPYSSFREAATLNKEGQLLLYKQIIQYLNNDESEEDNRETRITRPRIEQLISNIKKENQYRERPDIYTSLNKEKFEEYGIQSFEKSFSDENRISDMPILNDDSIQSHNNSVDNISLLYNNTIQDTDVFPIHNAPVLNGEYNHVVSNSNIIPNDVPTEMELENSSVLPDLENVDNTMIKEIYDNNEFDILNYKLTDIYHYVLNITSVQNELKRKESIDLLKKSLSYLISL